MGTTLPKKQREQMPRLYFPEFLECRPFEAVFPRGLETSGPRWRQERAVSIFAAFAWKVFEGLCRCQAPGFCHMHRE